MTHLPMSLRRIEASSGRHLGVCLQGTLGRPRRHRKEKGLFFAATTIAISGNVDAKSAAARRRGLMSRQRRAACKKLRLTGGEPLVQRNVMQLFNSLGGEIDNGVGAARGGQQLKSWKSFQ